MSREKRKDIESLLGRSGIYRAGDYFAREKKERASYPDITEVVPEAERIRNEWGEIVYRKLILPVAKSFSEEEEGFYYCFPVRKYINHFEAQIVERLCYGQRAIKVRELLFLDLETTGLAGGTGTYPILIGIGYFQDAEFILEQFFMEDFDRELALLMELALRVGNFSTFVTYNGKSFDIPILRTRFTLHRLVAGWDKPNIDLLHLIRRLWRGILTECSLNMVEKELLKIQRQRDVDGSMVPQIYFDYLRRGDPKAMAIVFDHNAQDVISLATLLARLCYYYQFPEDEEVADTVAQLGLSKLYERNGETELCLQSMERAMVYCRDRRLSYFISCHIARFYKRLGRWQEALEVWEGQIESGRLYNLEPFIELAKYYEWQAKDHKKARQIVERALNFVDEKQELSQLLGNLLAFDTEKAIEELTHRLRRLQRRLSTKGELLISDEEE